MNARMKRFGLPLPRDKADTLLLLVSALLVLAPHAGHLPLWVSLVCGATLLWRGTITARGTRQPPGALLLPVALAAMAGVYATFHTLLGRDAGVAMLVLLVAFKMLEMHARRDLFVVVYLCFFLVLANFFYSQSIATGLLMAVSIVALLSAQLSFQYTGAVPPLRTRLLLGVRIVAMAAPLALVLFYVFPRVQGPLWGLPGDASGGRTGLSNSMSPGNLSSLAQSDEPAFRVKFLDAAPPQSALYWRGIVLGTFDGRTWTQTAARQRWPEPIRMQVRGKPIRHQVTLEPSGNRWLFALELPEQLPQIAGNPSGASSELEMTAAYPLEQRVRYDAASYTDFSIQADAQLADSARWLMLPAGFNPLAMDAGEQLQREPDPARRVAQVLARFRQDSYAYTLEPPLLGRHSVDEFLYNTKAGFCEHYAGAFVFLMRAAGVPARVVTGYQGGEANPVDGYLTVRQSDAHAWAEVWLAGRGWTRVDPTAAVAPDRVRHNLARALPRKAPFGIERLGNLIDFNGHDWLAGLRFQWNAMNNGWNQWVLNYNPQRQQRFLENVQDAFLNWRSGAGLVLVLGLAFLSRMLRGRIQSDPIDALYLALCQQLGRQGLARTHDEGPSGYALRVAELDLPPHKKSAIERFLRLYSAYKYGPHAPDRALAATLRSLLNESR